MVDDPEALALLARDMLASASEATLLMTGPVRASEPAVLLLDRDGIPHLSCERGSAVAAAARLRQPAVLTVAGRRPWPAGAGHPASPSRLPVTLALAGRLHHVRSQQVHGDRTARLLDVIAMHPARVAVDVGRDPEIRSHVVPLDAYARATPDPIAGFAARTIDHTNACHGDDLRRYVSARFDLPEAVIAGAMLARLDRLGATLRWVDAAGAHTATVTFARPATCPTDLAALLRTHLTAARAG